MRRGPPTTPYRAIVSPSCSASASMSATFVPPGLHFKFPFGVDTATIVPVKRQLKQEFGFATPGARDPYQSAHPRDRRRETQMVTGELNAALVEWMVQYRIADPGKFLFEVRDPSETLHNVPSRSCEKY